MFTLIRVIYSFGLNKNYFSFVVKGKENEERNLEKKKGKKEQCK